MLSVSAFGPTPSIRNPQVAGRLRQVVSSSQVAAWSCALYMHGTLQVTYISTGHDAFLCYGTVPAEADPVMQAGLWIPSAEVDQAGQAGRLIKLLVCASVHVSCGCGCGCVAPLPGNPRHCQASLLSKVRLCHEGTRCMGGVPSRKPDDLARGSTHTVGPHSMEASRWEYRRNRRK